VAVDMVDTMAVEDMVDTVAVAMADTTEDTKPGEQRQEVV